MASNPENKRRASVGKALSITGKVFAILGKVLGTFLLIGILTALIFGCIFAKYVKEDLSTQTDFSLENFTLDQTSVIYYMDPDTGEAVELQQLYGTENRTWVAFKDIPKDLINACVAIEDKRFYEHQGVDWLRTLKASYNMFVGGESTYGASTLTQQLIKNVTDEDEVTVRRKLVEIFRALEFEKHHSKDEILTWYLNTIYLGEGCYGVQSASRVYFGKDVSELTTAECASLIGITNNPSIYDPYINPEKNRDRQLTILWEMYDQGFILTEEAYNEAVAQEMVFVNRSGDETEDSNSEYYSYFVDQVIRDVTADLREQYGYSEQIAEQMVMSGGYSIYCTLNPKIQAAVDEVYENLDNIPKTDSEQQLQSGIAIVDNATGDLVAVAGGVGEKTGSLTFNRATQALLSPGSTIKPVTVYGPALDSGLITPATVYDDTPYSFFEGSRWPKNTDNTYRGLMTIRSAVSLSLNTVAVKVLADLTPEYSFTFAREKMGLDTLVDSEVINGKTYSDIDLAPLALGGLTRGVTIQDMAAAYATFANQGQYREARTYTKVTQMVDGVEETVLDNTQDTVAAVSAKAAWYMTDMLEYAVEYGTGSPARIENMAVAGKTGTTTNDQDRWFCGYTPYYTAAVWCGYDVPEEVNLTESSTNPAAYLWQLVMEKAHEGLESRSFQRPTDVVEVWYCRDSGKLATEACRNDPRGSREVSGLLAMEDAPTDYCDVHKMVEICDESGQMANEYCDQVEGNGVHEVGLLDLLRAFPSSGVIVADQSYVIYRENELPSGYYAAISPNGTSVGDPCTVHTEESVETEEPNGTDDVLDPDAPENPGSGSGEPDDGDTGQNGGTTSPDDSWMTGPEGTGGNPVVPEGWEDPANGGSVPND